MTYTLSLIIVAMICLICLGIGTYSKNKKVAKIGWEIAAITFVLDILLFLAI